jgi:hypothetical protein
MQQLELKSTLTIPERMVLRTQPFFPGEEAIAIRDEPGVIAKGEVVTVRACYLSVCNTWVVVTTHRRIPYADNLRRISHQT